jgi:hypothetical protein
MSHTTLAADVSSSLPSTPMTTKPNIYALHPKLSSFGTARPRGDKLYKTVAHEFAQHKTYMKQRAASLIKCSTICTSLSSVLFSVSLPLPSRAPAPLSPLTSLHLSLSSALPSSTATSFVFRTLPAAYSVLHRRIILSDHRQAPPTYDTV